VFVCLLQAMRLFVGVPVWTPHNRPQEQHPSRVKYLQDFAASSVAAAWGHTACRSCRCRRISIVTYCGFLQQSCDVVDSTPWTSV